MSRSKCHKSSCKSISHSTQPGAERGQLQMNAKLLGEILDILDVAPVPGMKQVGVKFSNSSALSDGWVLWV